MSTPIVVERHVAAPPSVVYSYLTESAKWSLWQGVEATLEARPGGTLTVEMPNGSRASGRFIELETDRRVVFSWGWGGYEALPPGSTTVEIELIADGLGTLIRLTHTGLPADEVEQHTAGWNRYLPRLSTAAEGGAPGPDAP